MRILLIITGCFYFMACSLSCKSGKNVTTSDTDLQATEHTNITPDNPVNPEQVTEIAAGINKFGFDLFRELSESNDFLIFSPYSISSAMAMCYAGARENTAAEMNRVMHFNPDQELFHPAFGYLHELMLKGSFTKENELRVANALWAQDDIPLLDKFCKTATSRYSAKVQNVSFKRSRDVEESRLLINKWVEEQTMDKITELIKPDALSTRTRLVLTNAIYFRGDWLYPFNQNRTSQGEFRTADNQLVTASFMNQQKPFLYYADDDFQAIEMPYKGKDLAMLIILPKELLGIQQAMTRLNEKKFSTIRNHMDRVTYNGTTKQSENRTEVSISLPKFTSSAEFVLNDALKNMGMTEAFNQLADFSGMSENNELFISVVVHKTYIDVNEAGTEAAAATGVGMALKSGYVAEPKVFTADHPFFYTIYHKESGAIIFAGWLENPA